MRVRIHKAISAGAAALLVTASSVYAQGLGLRGTSDSGVAQAVAPDLDSGASASDVQPQNSSGSAASPPPSYDSEAQQPTLGAAPDPSGMINYGKPKTKKPKLYQLYKPNPKTSPPLPPLVPYATSSQAKQGLRNTLAPANETNAPPDPDIPVPTPGPTVAVLPTLPTPRKLRPDPDPYAPTGVDVGSLRLFPYAEFDTGYETNPNRVSIGAKPSPYVRAETGLKVESQWSQNSLTADLHGGYSDYFANHQADRPDASGTIVGRVDVTRDTQINTETRFSLATQQPGSPQLAIPNSVFIANRPLITSYGETLGVTQYFSRWQVALRGSFDRVTYGDATQSDGTILALSTESYNEYGLQGRLGYELMPGFIPFVQLRGDLRRHDDYIDFAGFARDSNGIEGKAGSQFDLVGGLFKGEISGGYTSRTYADARLPQLAAPTIDGSLTYSITPLTRITLQTGTNFSETTISGTSGAISHTVSLQLAHALTRELTITATGTYQHDDYVGGQPKITDDLYTAVLAAEYKLTRSIVLLGSYRYERLTSPVPNLGYNANVFLLGVRLQR